MNPSKAAIAFLAGLGPTECWPWQGTMRERGYGIVHIDGRNFRAHRVAWELLHGPIPEGMTVDHMCHNADPSCPGGDTCPHRRCVNPAHLDIATAIENALRARARHSTGTRVPYLTHPLVRGGLCRRGHLLDETNAISRSGRSSGIRCRACRKDDDQRRRSPHLVPTLGPH